jgi:hypothetical protein
VRRPEKKAVEVGVLLLTLLVSLGCPAEKIRPAKVTVQFLAESTAFRSSWAENQYVYLIEIVSQQDYSGPELARLIDEFPPYEVALSAQAMTATPTGAVVKIVRDQSCDVAYHTIPLRTAPGDLRAILPRRFSYRPELPRAVGGEEVVPCYRRVRR